MQIQTRDVTTDNGDYLRVIEWSGGDQREYETIVCEYPVDDPTTFIVRAYEHKDDEQPSYQTVFEMRDLSFSPISIAGLGERERLTGVSQTEGRESYDDIPSDVLLSLHSLGFTAVPQGEGWLDGV